MYVIIWFYLESFKTLSTLGFCIGREFLLHFVCVRVCVHACVHLYPCDSPQCSRKLHTYILLLHSYPKVLLAFTHTHVQLLIGVCFRHFRNIPLTRICLPELFSQLWLANMAMWLQCHLFGMLLIYVTFQWSNNKRLSHTGTRKRDNCVIVVVFK